METFIGSLVQEDKDSAKAGSQCSEFHNSTQHGQIHILQSLKQTPDFCVSFFPVMKQRMQIIICLSFYDSGLLQCITNDV